MNRKKFLKTSATMVTGILTIPSLSYGSSPYEQAHSLEEDLKDATLLWNLVGRFAFAVGASVASELITDYIKRNWTNRDLKKAVDYSNMRMRNDGFTDMSQSNVIKGSSGEFMYAAQNPFNSNVCTPVINQNKYRSAPITMVEGPALAGLVPVAERFKTKKLAHEYLMPVHQITEGQGSFENGLAKPTVYVSRKGNVKVSYNSRGNGKGVAYVSVTDNYRRKIVDQAVDIEYQV